MRDRQLTLEGKLILFQPLADCPWMKVEVQLCKFYRRKVERTPFLSPQQVAQDGFRFCLLAYSSKKKTAIF